jgi:hypothetical protein
MRLFLFFLLLSITASTAIITCLTKDGFMVSAPDVKCAECEFLGHLVTNQTNGTHCIYDDEIKDIAWLNQLSSINQTCDLDDGMIYCRHHRTNECVKSQFGVGCSECNSGLGFLVPSFDYGYVECQCYSKSLDPKTNCLPAPLFNSTPTWLEFNLTYLKVTCEAHQSVDLGCFEKVDSSGHKYGEPNPPVPTKCCLDIYGPPPGELNEIIQIPLMECNTIGTPDPNLKYDLSPYSQAFKTCSGHGIFNFTSRECECDFGWDLGWIGMDFFNSTKDVFSCNTCKGYFGPNPHSIYEQGPYCNRIYSPNPISGISEECGGRGTYIGHSNTCSCYSNSTIGYWKLGTIRGIFNFDGTESIQQSCIECDLGKKYPYCLDS